MGPSGVRGVVLFAMASHAVGRQFARLDIDVSTSQTVAGGALASFELCNSDVLEPILAAQSFCSDLTGVHDLECVDQVVRAMTHWASSTLMSRKSLTMRGEAALDDWLIMAAAILVNAAITAHSFVRTPTPRPLRRTLVTVVAASIAQACEETHGVAACTAASSERTVPDMLSLVVDKCMGSANRNFTDQVCKQLHGLQKRERVAC